MSNQISLKNRVCNIAIQCAMQYESVYVKKNYLMISEAFVKRQNYIIEAEPTNYLHLLGVSTNLSAIDFYKKCLNASLTENDFDLSFHGRDKKFSKGSIRQKILTIPDFFNIFSQNSYVEEDFAKNVVRCSFASSNGSCTVGFISTPLARPMTLLRGNELHQSKAKPIKIILSKARNEEKFSQILVGSDSDIIKYMPHIVSVVDGEKLIKAQQNTV